jgi:hypothetical protein
MGSDYMKLLNEEYTRYTLFGSLSFHSSKMLPLHIIVPPLVTPYIREWFYDDFSLWEFEWLPNFWFWFFPMGIRVTAEFLIFPYGNFFFCSPLGFILWFLLQESLSCNRNHKTLDISWKIILGFTRVSHGISHIEVQMSIWEIIFGVFGGIPWGVFYDFYYKKAHLVIEIIKHWSYHEI